MMRSFFLSAFSAFLFAAMIALAQQQSPQSSQRAQRVPKPTADRFQPFRYRMAYSAEGPYLAGFSEVRVKGDSPGASEQRRSVRGLNKNTDITLKRSVVHQDSSFAQWVNRSRAPSQARDLVIDSFDETGKKRSSMHVGGCVVAEYQAVPDLDGPANSVRIQVMTLHCSSMKRSTR